MYEPPPQFLKNGIWMGSVAFQRHFGLLAISLMYHIIKYNSFHSHLSSFPLVFCSRSVYLANSVFFFFLLLAGVNTHTQTHKLSTLRNEDVPLLSWQKQNNLLWEEKKCLFTPKRFWHACHNTGIAYHFSFSVGSCAPYGATMGALGSATQL